MKKTVIALAIVSGCTPAIAQTSCNYSKNVETSWSQQIEKTTDINRQVFPYIEDTRKCTVTAKVTIDGKEYPSIGHYVFGPDMSENDACDQALIKAKKETISIVSPEILSATTQMDCSQKKTVQPVVSNPQPVITQPATTKIVGRRLVVQPSNSTGYTTDPFFTRTDSPATGVRVDFGFQTNIHDILGSLFQ